jgi:RimJ/RimL family protein N-acetyltransferase
MAQLDMINLKDKVLLRDVVEADLPIFFEHQLDPEATEMAAFPARGREAFMAHWTNILNDETTIKQTILFDGQVAGNIVCFEQAGEQDVGFWLGRDYWGRGIATQELSQFLGYVKTRPLYARVAKHNIGSIRVLEKCGFTISGEDKVSPGTSGEEIEEFILELNDNVRDETP